MAAEDFGDFKNFKRDSYQQLISDLLAGYQIEAGQKFKEKLAKKCHEMFVVEMEKRLFKKKEKKKLRDKFLTIFTEPKWQEYQIRCTIDGSLPEKDEYSDEYEFDSDETCERELHEEFPGLARMQITLTHPQEPEFKFVVQFELTYELRVMMDTVQFRNEQFDVSSSYLTPYTPNKYDPDLLVTRSHQLAKLIWPYFFKYVEKQNLFDSGDSIYDVLRERIKKDKLYFAPAPAPKSSSQKTNRIKRARK